MSNTNSTGTMDPMVELARLRAENEALKAKDAKRSVLTMKVSDKGACSLYGMGRFPVTLYAQQWEKVLNHADTIRAFLKDNQSRLAVKE